MSDCELDTPVAFIVFNRPEHTKKVFDVIASVRPKRLFIIADGPRLTHPADADRCKRVREIVANVTWPCDVQNNLADTNMSCRERTISGTNWVFDQADEAIFLEDDTVPHPSFFRFCKEVLQHYRDDHRVMAVTGVCLSSRWTSKYSYCFSLLACEWGRAFWRRSWKAFDPTMRLWQEVRDNGLLSHLFYDQAQAAYWRQIMESTYRGKFDSWGYPFMLSCWLQGGLTVVPEANLVRNIGFGPDSTHTKVSGGYDKLALQDMVFPLRHPPMIARDYAYDDYTYRRFIRRKLLPVRLMNRIRRTVDERWFDRRQSEFLSRQNLLRWDRR